LACSLWRMAVRNQ